MKSKLQILTIVISLLSLGVLTAAADTYVPRVQVPQITDLAKLASIANSKNLPVLLVFSAKHCSYCELLEDEILKPMLLSGDYSDRVLIHKVMIDDETALRDFNGDTISGSTLSQRYNVYVTPTMLFLNANGQHLSERIIGINTVEMFGGLVDQAINTSLKKLRPGSSRLASNSPSVIK